MKTSSLEVPIMVGYNLVKKGPYGLSLMVGPKLKYNYKIAYTVESSTTHVEYVNDNTLTVYIKRLRDKIEDNPKDAKMIKTVRGMGYKMGD